jgi:hypothetical protein
LSSRERVGTVISFISDAHPTQCMECFLAVLFRPNAQQAQPRIGITQTP